MLRSVARSKGTWVAMLAALGLVLIVVLTSPGSHPKPAQAQTTQDPLTAAKFALVVDGTEIAAFNELGGVTSSIKLPRADGKAAQLEFQHRAKEGSQPRAGNELLASSGRHAAHGL